MSAIRAIICALTAALLGQAASAQTKHSMSFRADTTMASRLYGLSSGTGIAVYASGVIDEGTTQRLLDFLRANRIRDGQVVFDSPGGSLAEGMKLGRAIRQLRLFTGIGRIGEKTATSEAICASACAYAFAGGTSRFMPEGGGRLGLHQFYTGSGNGASEGDTQIVGGLLAAYLNEMGIDAKAFALASVTDHEGILWLTPDEALELGFANNGIRPTEAEIKILEMRPYLRLEQDRFNVTTRYLFICDRGQMALNAGVVTDPTTSAFHAENVRRAYIELDGHEVLARSGAGAVTAKDSVLWLDRMLTAPLAAAFLQAKVVNRPAMLTPLGRDRRATLTP